MAEAKVNDFEIWLEIDSITMENYNRNHKPCKRTRKMHQNTEILYTASIDSMLNLNFCPGDRNSKDLNYLIICITLDFILTFYCDLRL